MTVLVTVNQANLQAVLGNATEKELTRAAIRVQNLARRLAPVDTGHLRRSITWSLEGQGVGAEARVGSNLEYSLAVESGSGLFGPTGRRYTIRPKHAKALRFKVGSVTVFASSVSHPGVKPRPYLKPALAAVSTA